MDILAYTSLGVKSGVRRLVTFYILDILLSMLRYVLNHELTAIKGAIV